MATGNIVFLHPLGATLPPGPSRVPCANLHAQLEVARVDIHSTIMNGQTTLQGPSSIAHSSSDRDPGILLSRIIAAPFNATITALATSLDGNYLAIGDDHGRVEVYDASNFSSVGGLAMANAAAVQHLAFHPFKSTSGQYLEFIATSATQRVLVARLEKGTRIVTMLNQIQARGYITNISLDTEGTQISLAIDGTLISYYSKPFVKYLESIVHLPCPLQTSECGSFQDNPFPIILHHYRMQSLLLVYENGVIELASKTNMVTQVSRFRGIYTIVAASFTSTGEFLATITSFRAIALYRKTADGFKLEAFDDFSDLRAKGYLAEGISWIDDRSLIVTDIRGRFIKLVRSPADHDEILHPRRKRVIIDTPIHYQAKVKEIFQGFMGGKPVVFAVLGEGRGCVVAVVGLHNDANHDCTCQDLTADVDELSSNASQRDSYHRQRLEIPRPTIAIRSYPTAVLLLIVCTTVLAIVAHIFSPSTILPPLDLQLVPVNINWRGAQSVIRILSKFGGTTSSVATSTVATVSAATSSACSAPPQCDLVPFVTATAALTDSKDAKYPPSPSKSSLFRDPYVLQATESSTFCPTTDVPTSTVIPNVTGPSPSTPPICTPATLLD